MLMNGKQVIKKLEDNGWMLSRVNGSHHIMIKSGMRSVPVPVHGNSDIGIDLLKRIEKQSGVKLR